MENTTEFGSRIDMSELHGSLMRVRHEIHKVIVGQEQFIDHLLIALLSRGHVLIEGVPGIAKTLTAKLIAKTIDAGFSRIQFTPDLMPSDVLGTNVFNVNTSKFEFNRGPIFSNVILIDEINRAPAKTQAALFEVMEEFQVTVDGKTYPMSEPFWVLATQNPIEQEGTYRLPEAQLDRFFMKINVRYPSLDEEILLLNNKNEKGNIPEISEVEAILTPEIISGFRELTTKIYIEPGLIRYIAQITDATRTSSALYLGASPRASVAVMTAAKALAAIKGRDFVTPEDIKEATVPVLAHRLILTPEKEMEGMKPEEIIPIIVESIEVPR